MKVYLHECTHLTTIEICLHPLSSSKSLGSVGPMSSSSLPERVLRGLILCTPGQVSTTPLCSEWDAHVRPAVSAAHRPSPVAHSFPRWVLIDMVFTFPLLWWWTLRPEAKYLHLQFQRVRVHHSRAGLTWWQEEEQWELKCEAMVAIKDFPQWTTSSSKALSPRAPTVLPSAPSTRSR